MASVQGDKKALNLALSLSKLGLSPPPCTKHDGFYTPYNESFYSKYEYSHLDRKSRQIRLLKVFWVYSLREEYMQDHPHWINDPESPDAFPTDPVLACEVIDGVPLSKCSGKYLTLSYAAGNPRDTDTILVNGCMFEAFAQLAHALKCALFYCERKSLIKDGHCLLWADQICINQSNPEERGHQVMMMRDIYSHSATTLVCLSTKFRELYILEGPAEEHNGLDWFMQMSGSTDSLFDVLWNNCGKTLRHPSLSSFLAFVRSPWWTRSWVYQEFMCAQEVRFIFEQDDGPWEEISTHLTPDPGSWADEWSRRLAKQSHLDLAYVKQLSDDMMQQEKTPEGAENPQRRSSARRIAAVTVDRKFVYLISQFRDPKLQRSLRAMAAMLKGRSQQDCMRGDLRVLLHHARNFRASDARDKIYAFIGLARVDYGFKPDYTPTNTAVHVHSDAAQRIFAHDKDLTYLLEQAFVGRGDLGYFLPSWVPDWNCQEEHSVIQELMQYAKEALKPRDSSEPLDSDDIQEDDDENFLLNMTGFDDSSSDKQVAADFRENGDQNLTLPVMGNQLAVLPKKWRTISPNLRMFALGEHGIAYTPNTARPEDEIWSLAGCKWLTLLRLEEEDKYYFGGLVIVIGDCRGWKPTSKIHLI